MASTYGVATYGVATYGDSSVGIGSSSSPQNVVVDLGSVYTLDYLNVMHGKADGRTYHGTKTEVSEDGAHWNPIFDSSIVGEYAESLQGHTVLVNQGPIVYNMSSQIIQQAGEIDAVVDKDGQTGSISLKSDAVKFAFNNIASDITSIDAQGIVAKHSDGSYTRMGSAGLEHYVAGTGYPYHYLCVTGTIAIQMQKSEDDYGMDIDAGAYTVQLPNEFKGKNNIIVNAWPSIVNGAFSLSNFWTTTSNLNTDKGTFTIYCGQRTFSALGADQYELSFGHIMTVAYIAIA